MNNFIRSWTVLLLFMAIFPISGQQTEILYLSGKDAADDVEWEFYCTNGRNSQVWTRIRVPSVWEQEGFGTYNYGHDWKDVTPADESGIYRHKFNVPSAWKGKKIDIVFDGSMTDTEVKINGKLAGPVHQGAFYRFRYDITKFLKPGKENLLEVKVSKRSSNTSVNKAEREADFWIFGGIFRPVFLEAKPPVHLSRIALDPKADGSLLAKLELNNAASGDEALVIQLFDRGVAKSEPLQFSLEPGEKIQTIQCKFEDVVSWNPENPYLYDLQLSLMKNQKALHQVRERIGFRTVELRKHDGIYVNGRRVVFKGVNRHSFRPETGRCLSDEDHLEDITLMKEMNMNAVRMSHYIPDKRFLDLCDSLGLFVLNEITGWHDGYDSIVGPKLIKEAVLKDENHPCVIIWDHGNEGGWNFANEKYFHLYDVQKRPVIYPWLLRNGVDTRHYPHHNFAISRFIHGNDPFMPLEFMHGLYDGGHGAGLDEFWNMYQESPLHAGGFLWVFADEALLRKDMEETFYDSDGNHAPDGILGPHLEKEASFYTIKEIWSPVQVHPLTINRHWNGELLLENKYIYTDLSSCSFKWECVKTSYWSGKEELLESGSIQGPEAAPGESRKVSIDCSSALQEADIFRFRALDKEGKELYAWTWPIPEAYEQKSLQPGQKAENDPLVLAESTDILEVKTGNYVFTFNRKSGILKGISRGEEIIELSGGVIPAGVEMDVKSVSAEIRESGNFLMEVQLEKGKINWTVYPDATLRYEADLLNYRIRLQDGKPAPYAGISFEYPETAVKAVRWLGDGPYRVWKNRVKGVEFGVWEKAWNNTVTGESYTNLVYPEFKGYHANLYWMELQTSGIPLRIRTETPNLFFKLYTPQKPMHVRGGTYPDFPEGDLSFLYEIPGIGTKFKNAEQMGPSAQKGVLSARVGDQYAPIILWFEFLE